MHLLLDCVCRLFGSCAPVSSTGRTQQGRAPSYLLCTNKCTSLWLTPTCTPHRSAQRNILHRPDGIAFVFCLYVCADSVQLCPCRSTVPSLFVGMPFVCPCMRLADCTCLCVRVRGAAMGNLSSYSFVLMTIYFLQACPAHMHAGHSGDAHALLNRGCTCAHARGMHMRSCTGVLPCQRV